MATPLSTGTFTDLVARGFRQVLIDEWPKLDIQYKKICNVLDAEELTPKSSRVSAFATATTKTEGSAATEHAISQMYDTSCTLYSYSNYYVLARELKDNDLYGVIPKAPNALKDAHRDAMEVTVANVLNNAFSGSYLGGDSKALCASDHPLVSGTASNLSTGDLSKSTLEAAIVAMRGTVDDNSKLLKMVPKILVVPSELEATAHQLIDSTLDPESAMNAVNYLNKRGIQIVVNDYLTDADAWFLIAQRNPINMFIGKGCSEQPELIVQAATDYTLNTIFQTYNRFGTTFDDWRGIQGSAGV